MSELLSQKKKQEISPGVHLIQEVTNKNAPLEYTGLKVLEMEQDNTYEEKLEKWEACVVALTGKITVSDDEQTFENIGTRESVFDKIPTDSVYVSNDKTFSVKAESDAKVLLAYAPSDNQLSTELIKADENSVEDRGKYSNKRHVHNILPDDDSRANSLLVVEVYTESGNWSSYPPHKHDQDNLPHESFLEEIYYHELNPDQGFIFQRVYTEDRDIDETMTAYNQDSVIVPKGYHPVGVPDGYQSYYLNVMAGPVRTWNFHNEKDHEWILERD